MECSLADIIDYGNSLNSWPSNHFGANGMKLKYKFDIGQAGFKTKLKKIEETNSQEFY